MQRNVQSQYERGRKRHEAHGVGRLIFGSMISLLFLFTVLLQSCGSGDPSNPTNDPNRPDGTVLMLFPFSDSCEITESTTGYLYDTYPVSGGQVIETKLVDAENRELRFYLPESSGTYYLQVKNGETVIFETALATSDKDLQHPEIVCQ